jgi:hypothetical protein
VEGAQTIEGLDRESERRAPVLARGGTALQALGLGEELERFGATLGALEPSDRRSVYELVRWLAASWIGNHGPSHRSLMVEATPHEDSLRVLIFTEPELDDPAFWRDLVEGAPPGLVRSWAQDRRGTCGLWFELEPLSRP